MKREVIITLIVLLFISPFVFFSVKGNDSGDIWTQDVQILDKPIDDSWWEKGYDTGIVDNKYKPVLNSIIDTDLQTKDNILKSCYSTIFVNPYNNTIFVVIKNLNDDNEKDILNAIKTTPDVNIKLRNGYATNEELQSWMDVLWDYKDILKANDVSISMYGVETDGKIHVGIQFLTKEKADTLKSIMAGKIPFGILCVYDAGAATYEAYSRTTHNDPTIAGLKETSHAPAGWGWASTGFCVTWSVSGVTHRGVLIAGHAINIPDSATNYKVYQPTVLTSYQIGNGGFPLVLTNRADVALVEMLAGQNISKKIYSTWDDIRVASTGDYAYQTVGDIIEGSGVASGTQASTIRHKQNLPSWGYPCTGGLLNQLLIDPVFTFGDSGCPIYTKTYVNPYWNAEARGMLEGYIGAPTNHDVYCPIDGINAALGKTFYYTP
ncbi:MAG: hypothetical protein NTV15_00765 [Candidatus Bathyarchaeota archaeon]|nr:hypothetical protein [Candidatus Bathyarchaeota archaeon]